MEEKLYETILADLKSDFSGIIRDTVVESVEEMLKPIHKKLDSIQQVVDHGRTETEEVGRDISDTKIIQSETAASLRELLSGVNKQSRNIVQKVTTTVETQMESIAEKVEDSVQPIIEDTMNKFVESKGNKIRTKKPRHWFRLPFFTRN